MYSCLLIFGLQIFVADSLGLDPTSREAKPASGGSSVQIRSQRSPPLSKYKTLPTVIVTNEDEAIFPTSSPKPRAREGKQLRADVADYFREDVADYPEEEISRLLRQTPEQVRSLYNDIKIPVAPRLNMTERKLPELHYSGYDDSVVREEPVCATIKRHVFPREANKQNSLVYIPNTREFTQVIEIELCQYPNDECGSYLHNSLPAGMTSICHQKYAYKKLLYMEPREKRMASDLFRYPSCCSCYIRTVPPDLQLRKSANPSNETERNGTNPIVSPE